MWNHLGCRNLYNVETVGMRMKNPSILTLKNLFKEKKLLINAQPNLFFNAHIHSFIHSFKERRYLILMIKNEIKMKLSFYQEIHL